MLFLVRVPRLLSTFIYRYYLRNTIWYNPPFNKNVRTNIAHDFLQLIDKHFPPANRLSSLFIIIIIHYYY